MPLPEPGLISAPDMSALTRELSTIAPTWRGRADRELPTQASGFPTLNSLLPGGGWPIGALIELVSTAEGIGEVSLTLPVIRQIALGPALVQV